jgi:hypothetical protein
MEKAAADPAAGWVLARQKHPQIWERSGATRQDSLFTCVLVISIVREHKSTFMFLSQVLGIV